MPHAGSSQPSVMTVRLILCLIYNLYWLVKVMQLSVMYLLSASSLSSWEI